MKPTHLEFRYGVMNSGKSMAILQMAHNYEENDRKIILVKPAIDKKGGDEVVSRIGPRRKVDILLAEEDSLLDKKYKKKLQDIEAILIDEANFLTTEQVNDLWYIAKTMNISVICFGLRSNFKTELFEGTKRLFELADKIQELDTICKCGVKARFNARMVNGEYVREGDNIVIDGEYDNTVYVPLCSRCYIKYVLKKNIK